MRAVATRWPRRLGPTLCAALLLTSCIGSITRDEFEAEVRSRGGGVAVGLLQGPIDDLARRLGTDDFQVLGMYASPESAIVTATVRDPENDRQVDRYTYRNGELIDTDPVRVGVDEDLDVDTIEVKALAIDRLDDMIDEALAAYDAEGGYVSSVQITHMPDPEQPGERIIGFWMALESPRSEARATFDADGELLGLDLS